eukprot:TRINITY_DN5349_c0_g1_i1.p2 TRINITY_DN5349_c0_g1~~TRINITY_DN5349_c0_g1_i1.p2  ORF type:complete len:314 (-),score=101.45 TRINITY_DN5349_c0_g1_i1:1303-2244(-)
MKTIWLRRKEQTEESSIKLESDDITVDQLKDILFNSKAIYFPANIAKVDIQIYLGENGPALQSRTKLSALNIGDSDTLIIAPTGSSFVTSSNSPNSLNTSKSSASPPVSASSPPLRQVTIPHSVMFNSSPQTSSEVASKQTFSGSNAIGKRVRVWWPVERQHFEGKVITYDAETDEYEILYDDGDQQVEAYETLHFLGLSENLGVLMRTSPEKEKEKAEISKKKRKHDCEKENVSEKKDKKDKQDKDSEKKKIVRKRKSGINYGPWTELEKELFKKATQKVPTTTKSAWPKIAELVQTKTERQCEYYFHNHLK